MDFAKLQLFSMMKTRMAYLSERQDVLAQNIANVDTPGYKPRDLRPLDFHKLAMLEARQLKMHSSSPHHMLGTKVRSRDFRDEMMHPTYETTPVDNAVVIEEQAMKVAHNQYEYQTTVNLYRKTAEMFRTAIGGGQ